MTAPALDGARAPQNWRRAIAAAAARARAVRIRSAWLRRCVDASPSLQGGPLYGSTLADLVAALAAARTDGADDAVPRTTRVTELPTRRSRDAAVPSGRPNAAAAGGGAAAASPAQRAATVTDLSEVRALSRIAPAPLLERLAAGRSPSTVAIAAARGNGRSARVVDDRATAASSRRGAGVQSPSARVRRFTVFPDLRADARARAQGTDHEGAFGSDVAASVSSAPLATKALRARIIDRAERVARRTHMSADAVAGAGDDGATPVERDWSRSASGPSVSTALLQGVLDAHASAMTSRARQTAAPNGTGGNRRDRARPANHDSADRAAAAARASSGTQPSGSFTTTAPPLPPRLPDATAPTPTSPSQAFPQPLDARANGAALVSPLATNRASAPARDSEDDLDLLSAKLDRILVEQARRHGVDV